MDNSRKNIKQKDISTQNRRRLVSAQEARGMQDALTPRPSTSTATNRPSMNSAQLSQSNTMKSRPSTAVKKSVCSNPPCAALRSKDPPLSEQDDNRGVDLPSVIKLYGRLEKSKVPDIQVEDVTSEVQGSYISPSQSHTVPSQSKNSRSIGVSMDSDKPSSFCGTKSGPCASQAVGGDTTNVSTSMEAPMQSYVDAAGSKKVGPRTGSVSPKRVLVSQSKVPCEGNQGPCATRVFKPSTQDKSTAVSRIGATSTPQYRNGPRNISPPNFTSFESPRNEQSYYRQVPRSSQSSNAVRNQTNQSNQTRSPPVQARSPNMGQLQYLQSSSNMSRSANMDRLQVPYSPRYDRSASLVRNPQGSPAGAGSYNQPTTSYYQRDEMASGQYQENPVPQFQQFPNTSSRRILRTPLPNTFSQRTPNYSISKPDVPQYVSPQTNFSPVQRSVPSVRYARPPVRKMSPNRQYMTVPRMEQQPVTSRGIPPVEGNREGFYQRTPQRRQLGKPELQGYAQQDGSPRVTRRRDSEQQSSNMRAASLGRQQQLAQSNVMPEQGYAGTGIPHKIFSRPTSSITKRPQRFNPPEQRPTENRNINESGPRRIALPVQQPIMSRPQPATNVSRIQKPSQLPSRPTERIPRIPPKRPSTVRPSVVLPIEANLGQSFQEFVSRSADVSKQDIDQFNQSKLKKIEESTPNMNAATRAMQSAARKKTLEKKAAMESIRKRQEEAKLKHEAQREKAAKISEAKRIAKSMGSALTREEIMALVREENKDIEAAANSGEVSKRSGTAPKDINSRAKILKMKGTVRPPPEKKSVLRKAKVDKGTSEQEQTTSERTIPTAAEDPKKLASVMITLDPIFEKTSSVLEKSLTTGTPSSVVKLAVLELPKNMDDSVAMMSLERGTPAEPMPSTSTYQPTQTLESAVVKKLFAPEKESDIDYEKLENLEEVAEELFELRDLSRFGDSVFEHSLLELEDTLDIPDPDAPSCNICTAGSTNTILRVQLRGSQPPPWFPGYLTVLPQSNASRFMLSRSSSLPMAQAWKATEPEYYPNESQIMV